MKIVHYLLLILIFLFFQNSYSHCQANEPEIEDTQVSILTCRSGDELYSTFGHTAIRIYNPKLNLDHVYNYGLFNFNTPNFYLKFMRGQLPYYLGAVKMEQFLTDYSYEKRSVFEQKLVLDSNQKRKILEFLANNSKSENRAYKYDFFYDNCATRVVDVYKLAGEISYSIPVDKKTFRDLLKENLKNLVWSDFGIDIVIGARADRLTNRRHQMFLPEYVMTNLTDAKLADSKKIAEPAHLVLDFEDFNEKRKSKATNWPLICTFILFLITLILNVFYRRLVRYYNNAILVICGLLGLFLFFMWFGTNHGATRDNWNVFWLNPIVFIYLLSKGKVKLYTGYTLIVLLIVSALNCLFTFLPQFFNFAFLPIILSLLLIMYKSLEALKNKTAVV